MMMLPLEGKNKMNKRKLTEYTGHGSEGGYFEMVYDGERPYVSIQHFWANCEPNGEEIELTLDLARQLAESLNDLFKTTIDD